MPNRINILCIGDIVGRTGRRTISALLPDILKEMDIDLVIANGENAAGGFGLTPAICEELFGLGIDILTSGNHIWSKKEIIPFLKEGRALIRPANYPEGTPGEGSKILKITQDQKIGVFNVSGRVFMDNLDCPFFASLREIEKLKKETNIIIGDFHGEATSEKMALGWFLDGKISAIVGTHTHVQTADERILPQGTAYITDIGMTGALDSVIGMKKEPVIESFLTQIPEKFEVAKGSSIFSSVIINVNCKNGKSTSITRYNTIIPGQN